MASLASRRAVLSVLSMHGVLTNWGHRQHMLQYYIHKHQICECTLCTTQFVPLSLSLTQNSQNGAMPQRDFVSAWTVMHSKQVCAGNQDWSSRYAAFLSPEFWKPRFVRAPQVCRGNEKMSKIGGAFTVCQSNGYTQTEEIEQLRRKCLTYIKIWTLVFVYHRADYCILQINKLPH